MREGRTIQDQLLQFISAKRHQEKTAHVASTVSKLVLPVRETLRFISEGQGAGVLDLNAHLDGASSTTVRDILLSKHPVAQEVDIETL